MVRIERARLDALGAGDVVLTSAATVAFAILVVAGRWVPGWERSAAVFAVLAAGPPVFRWLALRFERGRGLFDTVASFWLVAAAPLGHLHLGPVVDAVHSRLFDRTLALMDLKLFGAHPAVALGPVSGWAMDALLASYFTFYFWPAMVGLLLYLRRERAAFEQFQLALTVSFAINFFLYAMVPAVGPRFYLAGAFEGPLRGAVLAPYLESVLLQPAFMRDCFPSGHTAVALIVLLYAYRHLRGAFWVSLPVLSGLVAATVIGRFHYGVDLLAAVPLAALAVTVAGVVVRIRPEAAAGAAPEARLPGPRRPAPEVGEH